MDEFAKLAPIAVVKIGKGGSYIKSGEEAYHIKAYHSNCVDSTDARDLYASGFLYRLAHNYSLDVYDKIGSLVANNIVEVIGAKMDGER